MKSLKGFILCVVMLSALIGLGAQTQDWIWATSIYGSANRAADVTIDNIGNSYVTGWFSGSVAFGNTTMTSVGGGDLYIAKFDSDGDCVWATQAGGSSSSDYAAGVSVKIDPASENIYVTGYFLGSVTFGNTQLTSAGGSDVVVAKLSNSGNWIWAVRAGGTSMDEPADICIDNLNNILITGSFIGNVTFGSTTLTSSGNTDIFTAKMDQNGNWLWAKKAGGGGYDYGSSITADDNNIYQTGGFQGQSNFGVIPLSSAGGYDIFIAKLNSDGNWLWAIGAGGTDSDHGNDICIDTLSNIYITGNFSGNAIFGSFERSSNGRADIFVAKINSNCDWQWVRQAGGNSSTAWESGNAIASCSNGDVYACGQYYQTAVFGPITTPEYGEYDVFIAKLDSNGDWYYVKNAGGQESDYFQGLAIDYEDNLITVGSFSSDSIFFGLINLTCIGEGNYNSLIVKTKDPVIQVLSPNGSEIWQTGIPHTIYWVADNYIGNLNVQYSFDNGATWVYLNSTPISSSLGSYSFTLPPIVSTQCLIKVESAESSYFFDISDSPFTITSSLPPSVHLSLSNDQSSKLQVGRTYDISLEYQQVTSVNLEVSYDYGINWSTIAESIPSSCDTFQWTVTSVTSLGVYLRMVDTQNPAVYDWSDNYYTICQLEIGSPPENEIWVEATTRNITWDQANLDYVKLEYSDDGGSSWQNIISSTPADSGTYSWIVPKLYSTQCKLRISDADDPSIFDVTDNLFTLRPQIMLSNLNGGEYLQIYSIYRILWDATIEVSQVTLDYSINGGLTWITLQETPYNASLGYYDWFVPNTPSSQALVRVKKVGDTSIYDISESVFTITVETILANLTLLSSPTINFGSVYIEESSQYRSVVLQNTGGQDLIISTVHFTGDPLHFELQQPLPNLTLVSGEIDSLLVRFVPQTVGALSDTLYIVNNSTNQPLLKIRLNGTGLYVPPAPPGNVTIAMNGYDAIITWEAVTQNIHGQPLIPDYYLVFYNGSSDPETGLYYYLWDTPGLQFTHHLVGLHAQYMFYHVIAYKYYGRGEPDLSLLKPGMAEEEVLRLLR